MASDRRKPWQQPSSERSSHTEAEAQRGEGTSHDAERAQRGLAAAAASSRAVTHGIRAAAAAPAAERGHAAAPQGAAGSCAFADPEAGGARPPGGEAQAGSAGSRAGPGMEAAVAAAAGAVAAVVAPDGAWASAVLATADGFLVTNAHLLQPGRRGGGDACSPDARPAAARGAQPWARAPGGGARAAPCSAGGAEPYLGTVRVRLPGGAWRPAAVVHVFQGPLDLAVLALLPGGAGVPPVDQGPPVPPPGAPAGPGAAGAAAAWRSPEAGAPRPAGGASLRPVRLCGCGGAAPGAPVAVVGHALVHPRAGLAAGVTAGVLARVVHAEACGAGACAHDNGPTKAPACGGAAAGGRCGQARPAMLLTTAAVHPGAAAHAHAPHCISLPGSYMSSGRQPARPRRCQSPFCDLNAHRCDTVRSVQAPAVYMQTCPAAWLHVGETLVRRALGWLAASSARCSWARARVR